MTMRWIWGPGPEPERQPRPRRTSKNQPPRKENQR
jgi:hypothetical protein